MRRSIAIILLIVAAATPCAQAPDPLAPLLQYDLAAGGRDVLLKEASDASFFMLGELHGENEIPALIRDLWPAMWQAGYRHVAAEISPWAANRLEFGPEQPPIVGLWTQPEASFVASLKNDRRPVLWGCDIEEVQPHLLIRELAALNPRDQALEAAARAAGNAYQRRTAPALLQHARSSTASRDRTFSGVSLRRSLLRTLEVEAERAAGNALQASIAREAVMKELFLQQWRAAGGKPKVFFRFGRNHLHRGYDRRGVSTLGNFVAELAAAERLRVFNVAAFSGGGRIALLGPPIEFDERGDDPAFAYLAGVARYPATVFDLRPLRPTLHRIPEARRSGLENSLIYWADSYDAILYYRQVTPLAR
jgi:hypothetical protein